MEARLFQDSDYPLVCDWWTAWGWDCLPLDALPRIGCVVESDGKPVGAAFLYQTDSSIAIMDWYITSAEVRGKKRNGIIETAINFLSDAAQVLGFKSIISFARNRHLMKRMETSGFDLRDKDINLFVRAV